MATTNPESMNSELQIQKYLCFPFCIATLKKLNTSLESRIHKVFYNVNYVNVKNSTVDCKYLLFQQDFFFRLKPKQ